MHTELYLPQHRKESWIEANNAVVFLLDRYAPDIETLKTPARDIVRLLSEIFPIMDDLCRMTCRFCPDPCCLNATIWYDLKDILFLRLANIRVPDAQPLDHPKSVCRYLGPKGCILDRYARPFICSRYLCPSQMKILRRNKEMALTFHTAITRIKFERERVEDEFIRIST